LPKADFKILNEAIKKCFEFRKTDVPPSFLNALKKLDTTRLEKGWSSAVASVNEVSDFKAMYKTLLDHITKWEN
jgi:hypothetical protein